MGETLISISGVKNSIRNKRPRSPCVIISQDNWYGNTEMICVPAKEGIKLARAIRKACLRAIDGKDTKLVEIKYSE